eukprot:13309776-Alexandrium_andersonii.AAC.1
MPKGAAKKAVNARRPLCTVRGSPVPPRAGRKGPPNSCLSHQKSSEASMRRRGGLGSPTEPF